MVILCQLLYCLFWFIVWFMEPPRVLRYIFLDYVCLPCTDESRIVPGCYTLSLAFVGKYTGRVERTDWNCQTLTLESRVVCKKWNYSFLAGPHQVMARGHHMKGWKMQVIGWWKGVYPVEPPAQSFARREAVKAAGTTAMFCFFLCPFQR